MQLGVREHRDCAAVTFHCVPTQHTQHCNLGKSYHLGSQLMFQKSGVLQSAACIQASKSSHPTFPLLFRQQVMPKMHQLCRSSISLRFLGDRQVGGGRRRERRKEEYLKNIYFCHDLESSFVDSMYKMESGTGCFAHKQRKGTPHCKFPGSSGFRKSMTKIFCLKPPASLPAYSSPGMPSGE